MQTNPDYSVESLFVDIKELEAVLGEDDSVDTHNLERNFTVDQVVLSRQIGMSELADQHLEIIAALKGMTDSEKLTRALLEFESLRVTENGDIFSGYSLFQIRTGSNGDIGSTAITVSTDGTISDVIGQVPEKGQLTHLVYQLLERLKKRGSDSRKSIRGLMQMGEQIIAHGTVTKLGKAATVPMIATDDVIAPRKLPKSEVESRLEAIKVAIRKRIIELSGNSD